VRTRRLTALQPRDQRLCHDARGALGEHAGLRHAEEQVERQLAAVIEDRDAAPLIERADTATGDQCDVSLGELLDQGS
jgi:hypothetical protein